MNADDDAPLRRDDEGDFHKLVSGTCTECGCTLFRAQDDASVIWEPGASWDEDCRDRSCHCHTDAVIGARRE